MHLASVFRASALAAGMLAASFGTAFAEGDAVPRVSEPIVHENLAIYFLHGPSRPGPTPLTLQEALERGTVKLHETSNVNQLEIQNTGKDEVFVQAGDIVKGGRQDRTLMVSLILPARSGKIPIASFCVEQGRWSARGKEDASTFATSSKSVPSREMKLAMKESVAAAPAAGTNPTQEPRGGGRVIGGYMSETSTRQSKVWEGVRKAQEKLGRNLGGSVQSSTSATSLELSLESDKLKQASKAYADALAPAGENGDDIVGYVFAINGKISSADVYPSNALFRKMWRKQLDASITEAIGERNEASEPTPKIADVEAFLAAAEKGIASERPLIADAKLVTHDGDKVLFVETKRGMDFVHRNYLAK